MTVARVASAGHSRSQNTVQRARRNAVLSTERVVAVSVLPCAGAGWPEEVSVTNISAEGCSAQQHFSMRAGSRHSPPVQSYFMHI